MDVKRDFCRDGYPDVTHRVGYVADGAGFYVEDDGAGFYAEDDGAGIPDGSHEHVLESRFTNGEGGTGLGLSIVSQIATAHGWAYSSRTARPVVPASRSCSSEFAIVVRAIESAVVVE